MTPQEAVKICFTKYFDFTGRARRAEFWWFILFTVILGICLDGIETFLGLDFEISVENANGESDWADMGGPLSLVFSLATFFPQIAVTARRLHDIDRSGWWQVGIPLIVIFVGVVFYMAAAFLGVQTDTRVGAAIILGMTVILIIACVVWLIVWLAKIGQSGSNRFGDDPLTSDEKAA